MNILAVRRDERVKALRITDEVISVDLVDGRTLTVTLVWYPRLLKATQSQREAAESSLIR